MYICQANGGADQKPRVVGWGIRRGHMGLRVSRPGETAHLQVWMPGVPTLELDRRISRPGPPASGRGRSATAAVPTLDRRISRPRALLDRAVTKAATQRANTRPANQPSQGLRVGIQPAGSDHVPTLDRRISRPRGCQGLLHALAVEVPTLDRRISRPRGISIAGVESWVRGANTRPANQPSQGRAPGRRRRRADRRANTRPANQPSQGRAAGRQAGQGTEVPTLDRRISRPRDRVILRDPESPEGANTRPANQPSQGRHNPRRANGPPRCQHSTGESAVPGGPVATGCFAAPSGPSCERCRQFPMLYLLRPKGHGKCLGRSTA